MERCSGREKERRRFLEVIGRRRKKRRAWKRF